MSSEKNITQSLKKNFFTVILLAIAGSMIYGLPYFRLYYYDVYVEAYGLTNVQMGALGSAYGFMGLFSYIIGGVLADRFPAKKMLVFSLFATGIGGFLHLFVSNYIILVSIYALWGVTSLLTFWPALLKFVRMQATSEEQGRAYGIFEGTRGLTSTLHLAIATAIFGLFQQTAASAGLRWIIVFYSTVPILCGFIFLFLIKDPNQDTQDNKTEPFHLQDIFSVIKMPAIWFIVAIMFSTYTFNMSFYYFTPYASNVIGTSAVFAAVLTVLAQYCRLAASPAGGFLADKISRSLVMMGGFLLMSIGTLAVIFVAGMHGKMQTITLVVAVSIIYTAMYSNYGVVYSFFAEGKMPIKLSGVAIGIVATIGYLPEVLVPLIAGRALDQYDGNTGYFIYFSYMIIIALIGAVLCFIWHLTYGKRYKEETTPAEV